MLIRTLAAAALIAALATPAIAAQGVRMAGDDLSILASKDVGGDRWTIALSLSEASPLTVTGSVYRGTADPAFLWCPIVNVIGSADDIANAQFVWACYSAEPCQIGDCPGWTFVDEIVLPGSFWLPR